MNDPVSLVRYDAMVNAIAECHRIDELADIHNKALAMERYLKQANNFEAERLAASIRIRAEYRWGELVKQLQRSPLSKGGDTKSSGNDCRPAASPYAQAIEQSGLSERTARRWQELSEIPKAEFEAALADPRSKPTTAKLIRKIQESNPVVEKSIEKVKQIDPAALWLWGRCSDLGSMGFFESDPQYLFEQMSDPMRAEMRVLIPQIAGFFNRFERVLNVNA